eukprot:4317632-Prymnesium_polylepis.1
MSPRAADVELAATMGDEQEARAAIETLGLLCDRVEEGAVDDGVRWCEVLESLGESAPAGGRPLPWEQRSGAGRCYAPPRMRADEAKAQVEVQEEHAARHLIERWATTQARRQQVEKNRQRSLESAQTARSTACGGASGDAARRRAEVKTRQAQCVQQEHEDVQARIVDRQQRREKLAASSSAWRLAQKADERRRAARKAGLVAVASAGAKAELAAMAAAATAELDAMRLSDRLLETHGRPTTAPHQPRDRTGGAQQQQQRPRSAQLDDVHAEAEARRQQLDAAADEHVARDVEYRERRGAEGVERARYALDLGACDRGRRAEQHRRAVLSRPLHGTRERYAHQRAPHDAAARAAGARLSPAHATAAASGASRGGVARSGGVVSLEMVRQSIRLAAAARREEQLARLEQAAGEGHVERAQAADHARAAEWRRRHQLTARRLSKSEAAVAAAEAARFAAADEHAVEVWRLTQQLSATAGELAHVRHEAGAWMEYALHTE